jgi:hypothetical protein
MQGKCAMLSLEIKPDGEYYGYLVLEGSQSPEHAYLLINENTFIGYDVDWS